MAEEWALKAFQRGFDPHPAYVFILTQTMVIVEEAWANPTERDKYKNELVYKLHTFADNEGYEVDTSSLAWEINTVPEQIAYKVTVYAECHKVYKVVKAEGHIPLKYGYGSVVLTADMMYKLLDEAMGPARPKPKTYLELKEEAYQKGRLQDPKGGLI